MPKKKKLHQRTVNFTVVGLQYRLTKSARRQMAMMVPFSVGLRRELENPHDENAIAVHLTDSKLKAIGLGFHIGYLRRRLAERLAPSLDDMSVVVESAMVVELDAEDGVGEVAVTLSGDTAALATLKKALQFGHLTR
jgi:HIRAN domain